MKKTYNYYGLKGGEKLAYNLGREESFFFTIFSDGSNAIEIRTKDGRTYIFGDLDYCRRVYKRGISFQNTHGKNYILLKNFKKALEA